MSAGKESHVYGAEVQKAQETKAHLFIIARGGL